MELIKKIIVSILTIVGIALAGAIICAGVLVVFPETKIFGISYINTSSKEPEITIVRDIDMNSLSNEYTIEILAGNYNVELIQNSRSVDYVDAQLVNHVIGFTRELDSNKKAKLDYSYDNENKKVTFKVTEPEGLFLKRDTVLKLSFPEKFLNKNINIISTTNKGVTTFGTNETPLKVNNVTVSCDDAKGGVKLENAKINGNLNVKNILGRIDVKNNINGTVTIDSTIGTYTFGKIKDLVVVEAEEGKTNNPAITLDECRNVTWKSDSGSLVVNDYILGEINAYTKTANFNIEKILGSVLIEGESSNVTINQVGNFVENANSEYNSYNWKTTPTEKYEERVATISNSDNGNININKSFFELSLYSGKGKVTVKNAMRKVHVETKSGAINVDFIKSEKLTSTNDFDKFIYDNFTSYLDGAKTVTNGDETTTTYDKILSLTIKTVDGVVNATNIRNSIEVIAESSPITLNYTAVRNDSIIKTSSKAVTVKAPVNDFKITTKQDKNSSAKLEVKFGSLEMNSYNDEIVEAERMNKYVEDNFKCLDIKVSNATNDTKDVITITNTTGKISVTSY